MEHLLTLLLSSPPPSFLPLLIVGVLVWRSRGGKFGRERVLGGNVNVGNVNVGNVGNGNVGNGNVGNGNVGGLKELSGMVGGLKELSGMVGGLKEV